MNALLLNRDGFQMPADGWYQVAPLGEFAHAQAGLVQVVDAEACLAMANRFADEAKGANFAGLLVDFDHFSLDGEKRSEAAGWITALENRDGGLFAKIRWSDVGEEAVKGGRYRFLSPVWARSDCVDLGNGRVRPVRLLNAAVTNDPNLKGMRPLSNNAASAAAPGEPRFKWVLGDTQDGRHCPSCTVAAGQVHTMAEWDAGKVKPGAATLCCQGNCKCRLEEVGDPAGGVLKDVPVRKEDVIENGGARAARGRVPVVVNTGWQDEARAAALAVRRAKAAAKNDRMRKWQLDSMEKASRDYAAIYEVKGLEGMTAEEVRYMAARVGRRAKNGSALTEMESRFVQEMNDRGRGDEVVEKEQMAVKNRNSAGAACLANIGWTDAARAASLAVRRAKAAARGGAGGGGGGAGHAGSVASLLEKGYGNMTPDEVRNVGRALQAKAKTGADFTPEEMQFLQDSIDDPNAIPPINADTGDGKAGKERKSKKRDPELGDTDYRTWFEEDGLDRMPPKAANAYLDQLREKMVADDEPLDEVEEKFLQELTDKGVEGLDEDDPLFQWQMDRAKKDQRIVQATGMPSEQAAARVQEIEACMDGLQPVTPEEEAFCEAYHQAKSMPNRRVRRDDDAPYITALVNTGWTDQARVAALAVRRAKAGVRAQVMPPRPAPDPNDTGVYLGGSKYFDEASGQYRYPDPRGQQLPPWTVPGYPVKPGQPMPPPYRPGPVTPPGWPGKPAYPVRPGQPLPPPYQGPGPVVPPKKGTPVPIKPGYRFLTARARQVG